jgi:hypothetical protein
MVLLAEFLRELGAAHFNATVVEIISDDATVPSERLRGLANLRSPAAIKCCNTRPSNSSLFPHDSSSGRSNQASARRSLGRYHSEPIRIISTTIQSQSITSTALSRWTPNLSPCDKRDQLLLAPARSADRWGVTRNKSDSALLSSILPKRSRCGMTGVTNTVLRTLERKSSASKVISDMSITSSSKLRTPETVKQRASEMASEASSSDLLEDGTTIVVIEQQIEVAPRGGETRRRLEQEDQEHFIRSILESPGAIAIEERVGEKDDEEVLACCSSSTPSSCSSSISTRNVVAGAQAMIGFLLLVVQIISVELLGPVFLNVNQLLQTILETVPDSDKKSYGFVLLPRFRGVPAVTKVHVAATTIANDGSTIARKRSMSLSSLKS